MKNYDIPATCYFTLFYSVVADAKQFATSRSTQNSYTADRAGGGVAARCHRWELPLSPARVKAAPSGAFRQLNTHLPREIGIPTLLARLFSEAGGLSARRFRLSPSRWGRQIWLQVGVFTATLHSRRLLPPLRRRWPRSQRFSTLLHWLLLGVCRRRALSCSCLCTASRVIPSHPWQLQFQVSCPPSPRPCLGARRTTCT